MGENAAMTELIRDLQWQVTQMRQRGVTTASGAPFKPAHYARHLEAAIADGDDAVLAFVRGYLHKPATAAFKRLEAANAVDLSCEALVWDETKSYRVLFTDEDRAAVATRLAPHAEAVAERLEARRARQAAARERIKSEGLPDRWDLNGSITSRRRKERASAGASR